MIITLLRYKWSDSRYYDFNFQLHLLCSKIVPKFTQKQNEP